MKPRLRRPVSACPVKFLRVFLLAWLLLDTGHGILDTAFAVEVSPVRLELDIPADEMTRGELQITNRSPKPVEVRLSAGAYRFLQPSPILPSAETWLRFDPERFTLSTGSSTTVSFTVTPPPAVARDTAGEYLAAVLIDELPPALETKGSESTVRIVPRFALPVYLKIQGRQRVEIEVSHVKVQAGQSEGLLRVDTTITNRGTVHARLFGTLGIFHQTTGQVVQASPLGRTLPLLPSATFEVPAVVPLPPPGRYEAVITVEVGPDQIIQEKSRFEVLPDGKIHQST
ncbi:MAG: hypothetical protein HYZ90_00160 [Candidatus Omnitrophica bacterium]|nr:hypothetical protein [Candidatus Omnitrophota bacterium]